MKRISVTIQENTGIRRRPFTLLEIMVVFTIVAMVAATSTVGVQRLLADQRFRAGVAAVEDQLQLAQDVMLIYNTDVKVTLQTTTKGLSITLKADKVPPSPLKRYFNKDKILEGIAAIRFDDDDNEATFHFHSPGTVISRGVLIMSKKNRINLEADTWRSILLQGYPHPIRAGRQRELPPKHENDSEMLYPQELLDEAA